MARATMWMSRHRLGWIVVALLGLGACFSAVDATKIKCADDTNCPGGYTCSKATGTCMPRAQQSLDASNLGSGGSIKPGVDAPSGAIATGGSGGLAPDARSDGLGATGGGSDAPIDAPTSGGGGSGGNGPDDGGAGGSARDGATIDANASCTSNSDCASGSFCSAGICTPQLIDGSACAQSSDCQHGHCLSGICCNVGTCGTCNSCATGTCIPASNGATCGTGNYCNNGTCGACPDGSSCNPNNNPCQTGKISCSTGTAICQNPVNLADGTPTVCGVGKVCKNGACSLCSEGASCTGDAADPCHSYTISCSTGDPVCKASGNRPNTTPCGPGQTCTAGTEYDQAYCSNGSCPSQPTKTCPSTGCNGTACAAACDASHTACGTSCCANATQYCSGATCAALISNGNACPIGNNSACSSGNCSTGLCCPAGQSNSNGLCCPSGTSNSNGVCCSSGATGCNGQCCSGSKPYCSSGSCVECTSTSNNCPSPKTCGGGGVANTCGCTPNQSACASRTCGTVGDGCGGTLSCGSCPSGQTCNSSGACACSLGVSACNGCLGWGFDSGVGTWHKNADVPNAILNDVAQGALHPADGGTNSLTFFASMDPNNVNSAVIISSLCSTGSAVSVNGTTLSFEVYADSTLSGITIGWQGNYLGGRQTGGFLGDLGTTLNAGTWYSLNSGGAISGAPPLDAVQIMFIASAAWSGNIYIDNIQFQ